MKSSPFVLMVLAFVMFTGCKKDNVDTVILQETEYTITEVGNSGVYGKVTFTEDSNGKTEILIELNDSSTSVHPAYVRYNSASEGGEIALTLNVCECAVSHTVVSKLDGGTTISYSGLLKLDGHIAIHESKTDTSIVAVANIGSNANTNAN